MKFRKPLIMGVIVGILLFPTITLGGTFVSSLIQGKSVDEAVQILAEQMDMLVGRVTVVEENQVELEQSSIELESQLQQVKEENRILTEQLNAQSIEQNAKAEKETACRKASELRTAPTETKVAYISSKGTPIYASWAPNTTKELLEYIRAYIQNYESTGNQFYTHSPDYSLEKAQEHLPILEARQIQYQNAMTVCEG